MIYSVRRFSYSNSLVERVREDYLFGGPEIATHTLHNSGRDGTYYSNGKVPGNNKTTVKEKNEILNLVIDPNKHRVVRSYIFNLD